MEEVYIVISINCGNLPQGVYDSLEKAKEHVDTVLTPKQYHGCVCKYILNEKTKITSMVDNVYDNGMSFSDC